MKKDNAKVIYSRELTSDAAARMIAENTGAKVLELHSGHNISNKHVGLEEYSFMNIMIRNIYNLAEGLDVNLDEIEDFILNGKKKDDDLTYKDAIIIGLLIFGHFFGINFYL